MYIYLWNPFFWGGGSWANENRRPRTCEQRGFYRRVSHWPGLKTSVQFSSRSPRNRIWSKTASPCAATSRGALWKSDNASICSERAVRDLRGILERCYERFSDIETLLVPNQKSDGAFQAALGERLKCHSKKGNVLYGNSGRDWKKSNRLFIAWSLLSLMKKIAINLLYNLGKSIVTFVSLPEIHNKRSNIRYWDVLGKMDNVKGIRIRGITIY
jgi:hypothetical protein